MWWFARRNRHPQNRPLAEEVEPRILYSADLGAVMLAGAANDTGMEQRTLTPSGDYAAAAAPTAATAIQTGTPSLTDQAARALYAVTPLSFEANAGQASATTDFIARGNGYGIALSQGGADITLGVGGDAQTVRLNLQGGNSEAHAEAGQLLTGTSNYILGSDPSLWRTGIANYGDVTYRNVYDGVDVRYYGNQQQLEYDFLVEAGASTDAIRLRFDGVTQVAIDGEGNLVLTMNARGDTIMFKAPVSYQDGADGREAVASSYRLNSDGSIGFNLGPYDATRALVIDPVLNYASYFGTSGTESGLGVAVDAAGSVYVTGRTTNAMSSNLGAGGSGDVYVAKFSADLSTLIYSTRIGGTGDEQGNAIAVDSTGAVSVTGWTTSNDFPTLLASQALRSGGQDAFVFRLDPGGTALTFSTYLGGTGSSDSGNGIAIDAAGNVYAAGRMTPGLIPVTVGIGGVGFLSGDDAFVTKFNSLGVLQYSGLYGGSGVDYANAVAVDTAGNAYLVGNTNSLNLSMVNAYDNSYNDKADAFLVKVNASGTAILYSTYIGEKKEDFAFAVAVDNTGKAYVGGQTETNGNAGVATTAGAFATVRLDTPMGFIQVYDTTLSGAASLRYGTFLGGNNNLGAEQGDVVTGIAVGAGGRIVAVGRTDSTNFPVTADAYDSNNSSGGSMFMVVLNPLGRGSNDLLYGSFFGKASGVGNVALQGEQAVFTGSTSNDGLATAGTAQPVRAGGTDALVVSFNYLNRAPVLSGSNDLAPILEDALLNNGTPVSALVAGYLSDPDPGAVTGIAVVAADNSNGAWQYSRNAGAGWSSFSSPSDTNSRLLLADSLTRVRFVPNPNFAGTVTAGLTFRAWDGGGGQAGSTADTTMNGGMDPFSAATASVSIVVMPVNDAPVRTAGLVTNRTVAEDSGLTSLGLSALAYGTGGGADELAQQLTYTVTAVPASGIVVLADGVTLVNAGNNYTLAELHGMQIRTVTDANGGPFTFSWTVRDDGGTANGGTDTLSQSLTITVTAVNDAPVLAGANNLAAINEDSGAGAGTPVSALIAGFVSDVDTAAVTGIAVVGVDNNNGTWQYSRDGGNAWSSFGAPSDTAARLLAANGATFVRFIPNANFSGTVSGLTFRAWDQTSGAAGTSVNASVNGAATAFSAATASASITVVAVNDAPIRANGTVVNLTVAEDAGLTSLGLGTLIYTPGGGADEVGQSLSYTVTAVPALSLGQVLLADGTTAVNAGASLSLTQLQGLQFLATPNASGGPATLSWRVQDDGGTTGGGADTLNQSLTISVNSVNDAPVLAASANLPGLLEDAAANPGTLVSSLIAGQVSDVDAGALSGIAVVGVDNSNGSWQFSLNSASTWTALGAPSDTAARLLSANGSTLVRFVPNADFAGTASGLTFRAWDRTTGTAGFTANASVNGASSAFSSTVATASISITGVNDQPVRATGSTPDLTVLEDAGATSLGLGGVTYSAGGGADEAGQTFTYTVTAVPAASLGQVLLADGTTVVAAGTPYTLAQLQGMQFQAAVNGNGGPAAFSWSVTDSGGTANSGADTLTQSLSISVTSVNDAPVRNAGVANNLTVLEDSGTTSLGLGTLNYSTGAADEAGQTLSYTVTAVPAASLGQIVLADGTTVVAASTAYTLAQLQGMQFNAAANASGGPATFSWSVTDNGGTTNGGANSLSESLIVSVTAVNDPPVRVAGTTNNLTVMEDAAATSLGLGGLSYNPGGGAAEAGQTLGYTVTAIPAASLGQILLADGTTVVTAGTPYTLTQLQGMQFRAAANATGGPATFSWAVQDNGGTANTGLDTLSESLTISVTNVNDPPVRNTGVVANLTVTEDAAVTSLGLGTLTYSPGGDTDEAGQSLTYTVTAVPAASLGQIVLADGTTAVAASTGYTLAQLQGMQFKAAANANGGPATFSWRVTDNGGTANGGVDALNEGLTITLSSVNDAPVRSTGAVNNLVVQEDAATTSLGLGGLGYNPGGGTAEAGQTLSYTVTAVPAASLGQIVLADGTTGVTASTSYTLAHLQGMQFKAAANANGGPATFSWTVQDNGGTAGGGVDALSESLTISVASINDQPVITAGAVNNLSVLEASGTTTLGLAGLTYGPGGGADESGQQLAYTVLSVPNATLGDVVLADGTTLVLANTSYSLTQLRGMQFRTAAASIVGAADFIFQAQDDGGTASGGVDTLAQNLRITVGAVNDAPVRTAGAVNNLSVLEDAATTSLGLGGLTYGPGGGADEAGQTLSYSVTAVPPASLGQIVLADGTTAVSASTAYTLAQLQGMQFKAAANANGGPAVFGWSITDNGGTANGGVDVLSESLSLSVTPVNDQPVRTAGVVANLSVLEDAAATTLGLGTLAYTTSGGADEAGQGLVYTVTAIPAASLGEIVLANGTTAVTASTSYTLTELRGMQFKAAANANGGPANFSWSAMDTGGTANGGVDALAQSLTISVTSVNDAPLRATGVVNNLTVLEDAGATSLGLGALGYNAGGGTDEAGQTFTYTVTAIPAASLGQIMLADGTTAVTASTSYNLMQLQGMQFKAATDANGGPATFSWSVTDNGGTANGGANAINESLGLSVTGVNDAPVRTAGSVNNLTVLEDAPATPLGLGTLTYSTGGGSDEAGQTLGYTVTAVPASSLGQIVLADGTTVVSSGTGYTLAQLRGMQFKAAVQANGGPATFSWSVADNGGTANGGVNSVSESLTLSVTSVNDAPVRTAGVVSSLAVLEDSGTTSLGLGALGYSKGGGIDEAGQSLNYTVTAIPAATLGQIVLANGTTAVSAGTGYSLAQLQGMQFRAALDASGGPATFSWTVQDNGGTANGGVDVLNESLTLSVSAVNDQPVRATGGVGNLTVLEDAVATSLGLGSLSYNTGGGAAEAGQTLTYTMTAIPAASLGQIVLANGTTAVTASTSYTLAQLQGMQFKAAAHANGGPATFSWSITDNGGTANGGVNSLSESLTVSVTPVNDAPVRTAGSTNNLAVQEDSGTTSLGLGSLAYNVGGGADEAAVQVLGFTVTATPADSLGDVVLADGTTVVTAGASYSLAQLQGMQFKAAAGANGGPASFSWAVQDNGGTANGGGDTLSETLTISINSINDQPVRAGGVVNDLVVLEDSGTTGLGLGGLAYNPGGGTPEAGQTLSYTVTAVPAASLGQIVLANGTTVVTANTAYSLAQLQGMQFQATPAADGGPATFSWRVQDSGGTANGGVDTLAESLTISVTGINDQPVRTFGTVGNLSVLEDSAASLGLAALGYSAGGPGADEAAQTLGYTVTAVPSASLGQIVLADGTTVVSAGTPYTLAQLQGMQFKAAVNANGGPATFSWVVQDDGGTANGGVDTLSESLTISVVAVNDAPLRTAGTVSNLDSLEGNSTTSLGLAGLTYGAGGAADEAAQLLSYTVTAVPASALGDIVLADGVTLVTSGTSYTLDELRQMQFRAASFGNGMATFSWTIADDGGTANGGVDALTESLTIKVGAVNDAPVRTGGTAAPLVVLEGAPAASLGLGGLSYSPGGGADEAGQYLSYTVTAVPAASLGRILLADGTTVVTVGTGYLLNQLQGMQFLAAPDANGGPVTFSWDVKDDGGTAFGGIDTLSQSLTLIVTAVNDAPLPASGSVANLTVLEDSGTTPLGLAGVSYATGGGSDEAVQLLGYTITDVPAAALGEVVLADGVTRVVAGNSYSLAELQGMQWRTAPDANGGPALFAWTVRDDGGTAQGGVDALRQSLTISVTPVNDAPSGEDVVLAGEVAGQPMVLGVSAFKFTDAADAKPNNLMAVRIVSLPAGGQLTLDGNAVTAGQEVAFADIAAGKLMFAPAAAGTTSFGYVLLDDGGTANGGVNADVQVRILSVVLPPSAAQPPVPAQQPRAAELELPKTPAPTEPRPPAAPDVAAAVAAPPDEAVAAPFVAAAAPASGQGGTELEALRVAAASIVTFEPQRFTVNALSGERRAGDGIGDAPVFDLSNAAFANRAGVGGAVYEQFLRSLRSQGFIDELDRLRDEIRKDFNLEKTFAVSATGVTFGISFLYVLWLIRGGVLMSSYLAAMPAWRVLDPLPVLSRAGDEESDDEDALGPVTGDADDPVRTLRGF